MGIESIKEKLQPELEKVGTSNHFKRLPELSDAVKALHANPDYESGDRMQWANIDLVLKPEMYLLTGIPSSGKSTWLDNVIMNSIRMHDYKWAIFSPESHPIELHLKQLIEIYSGTNFYGKYNYVKTQQSDIDAVVNGLKENIYMMTPTDDDLSIERILELMSFLCTEYGVMNFVLDPYNEFSHTRPASLSETEYVSRFLGKVRQFINQHNAMVWIVAHPTKLRKVEMRFEDGTVGEDYAVPGGYDIAGSANFFNKPDVIISVHRDKDVERNPENKVAIHVQKVRRKTTGKLGCYWLKFNYNDGTYTSV